jgi:hypothetical protein
MTTQPLAFIQSVVEETAFQQGGKIKIKKSI